MGRDVRPEAFLDTGIFVAWMVREDRCHPAAAELFSRLPKSSATSLAVVSETYSLFLHRYGEERARLFRRALGELPGLTLLALDQANHEAAARVLERFRGLKLTYVDASSLAFMRQLRIANVWGTDRHLAIEGARLLPDEP